MAIDVVYPLCGGSLWQDNELRYSLRSLEGKFEALNIYVVGKAPKWFTGRVIPFKDGLDMVQNVYRKQRLICNIKSISDDFLYMNDDIYLLEPFQIAHYWSGTVYERFGKVTPSLEYWGITSTLPEWKNYSTHTPFVINKKEWLSIFRGIEYKKPFFIRDRYGNLSEGFHSIELESDVKYLGIKTSELVSFIHGLPFFSTPSYMDFNNLEKLMNNIYPTPSRWEKT